MKIKKNTKKSKSVLKQGAPIDPCVELLAREVRDREEADTLLNDINYEMDILLSKVDQLATRSDELETKFYDDEE